MTAFTIGHSTRSVGEVVSLLAVAGADLVADVRSVPRSRTNPQFNSETLAPALAAAAIGYRHFRDLGGLRRPRAESPNRLWRHDGFRGYADYASTPAFRQALAELEALAGEATPAVMCAEAVWWRCHRRIIADYLLMDGVAVRHILGPGKIEPASLTPGAVPQGNGTILYPG